MGRPDEGAIPMRTDLLLGDEAVAQAAIDAGIAGAFSYPGTPATEIFEAIRAHVDARGGPAEAGLFAEWSANEKVAYEEALGMSYAGRRSIVTMKHVGLNVAMDPFVNSALTGVNGGLVLVVADDPSMHSSQNEQDSRFLAEFAQIPCLEPSNQQEAYELTRGAFEHSESIGLPVMLRMVTRLCHSRANVSMGGENGEVRAAAVEQAPRGRPDPNDWTLVPVNARRRFRRLLEVQPRLVEISENGGDNELALAGPRGIIASGIALNYVREALGDAIDEWSMLSIRRYPLPASLVRSIVDHCEELFVVEEGYPFIERRLTGLLGLPGKAIRGKLTGELPITGELSPEVVAAALGRPLGRKAPPLPDLAARPPQLCKGCPHADSFRAIIEATSAYPEAILFSDIGCYALGVMPPFRAVHSCVDMGASISMAHGASRAGAHPVLCTIGDSTFAHSGMTGLIGAAAHDANMTVLVLDNSTVAMTGGQDSLTCGERLIQVLHGLGVDPEHLHVVDPRPQKHDENVERVRREIEHPGLSVIVPKRACIQIKPTRGDPMAATVGGRCACEAAPM
jgi:indolepyruvate ferredoxin oxidoreductase alpha subunit